jgi:long-subunit fatty acid transport protein
MNKSIALFTVLISSSLISAASQADALNYNFVELSYLSTDIDDLNVDGDGLGIAGSFSLSDNYHVFAGYSDQDFDFSINLTTMNVGLGYSRAISKSVDLVASIAYVSAEVDVPFFPSVDDDGYGLGLGVRAMANQQTELFGGLEYVNLSDGGSDTALTAGAGYYFTSNFRLSAQFSTSDDSTSYGLGVRYFFGE